MRTVYALFEDYSQAKGVVDELIARNFKEDDMNIITRARIGDKTGVKEGLYDISKAAGRRPGLEHLLAGTLHLAISDIGQVRAAGTMAKVLSSTAESNASLYAGLKEALVNIRVPEEIADFYRSGVAEGGLLFWLRTKDGRAREAADLIGRRIEGVD